MCDSPRVVRVVRKDLSRMYASFQAGKATHAVQYLEVPCGKCASCLRARQDDWAMRIECEASSWNAGRIYFIRLSYNPDHVRCVNLDPADLSSPVVYTLCKSDLQKFFKRLRKYWPLNHFRYFACGEYGDFGRPHYHVILFTDLSLDPLDMQWHLENRVWSLNHSRRAASPDWRSIGFCNVRFFKRENARYCAKYTTKDLAEDYYSVQERPFRFSFP